MNHFRAYVLVHEANVPTDKHDPNSPTKLVHFDEPLHKMIASGDEEFCQGSLERYLAKHPDRTGGVIETMESGDPWYREWMKVHA